MKIKSKMIEFGDFFLLLIDTIKCSFTRPFYVSRIIEQISLLGLESILISGTIGFVIGLVMTLQFGYGLASFGGTFYVPSIVSVSLMRELAPILTSLLVAARVGSGVAAELAAMKVSSQIDALRALATSPTRVLIVPRLIALCISLPFLGIFSALMGLIGGLIISELEFGITYGFYINKVLEYLHLYDVLSAMIKCCFFAFLIIMTACFYGLRTENGTRGVGKTATKVVVISSIGILISDFFLTKILLFLFVSN